MTAPFVHHVALSVRDIDRSADWYAGLLDLTLVAETDDGAPMKIFVNGCGQAIDLRQDRDVHPAPFTQTHVGLDHLAFSCTDQGELEAWLQRIRGRGIPHSPIASSIFGTHLTFRDPDGIPLEFFVPTAR